jgi:hypothetical protein
VSDCIFLIILTYSACNILHRYVNAGMDNLKMFDIFNLSKVDMGQSETEHSEICFN